MSNSIEVKIVRLAGASGGVQYLDGEPWNATS